VVPEDVGRLLEALRDHALEVHCAPRLHEDVRLPEDLNLRN
jgi:hypothetical protein